MKDFIKSQLEQSINFHILENVMMDEDYPSSFDMNHFKQLTKFAERVRYCDQHLKKVSSGSARIVYIIDETKVLKLAKNQKGVAQCETEIQWGQDRYYSSILAQTIDSHPDGLWVEMELALKVKKSDFQRLEGFNFDSFGPYLRNFQEENNGKHPLFNVDPAQVEIFHESQFVNSITDFMLTADSPAGDLGRLNSYGLVKREGIDTIVLIDFGLTGSIYDTYYSRK